VYADASESIATATDIISDFVQGQDKVDLSALLGATNLKWGALTATANGAWYSKSGTTTLIFADVTGDLIADLKVQLTGGFTLVVTDFLGVGVPVANLAPTLTAMAAPVATVNEDVQAAITLAALKAQGNEADADGTVDSFVVRAVSTGVLLIGTSAATATAWAAGTNDTIDATHQAYWTAAANASGTLGAFTVVARDNAGLVSTTAPVLVSVSVTPVNDAPVANADTLAATEDLAVTYTAAQLLGNDTDPDGNALSIGSVTSGAGGTAVLNANGTVTFISAANFNGTATFSYAASDGVLLSNVALVRVNVASVNDAPVATNDVLVATEDTPVTYTAAQLLGNDTDVDGPALSITSVTSGAGGTAVLNVNGTVTFTPFPDFNGAASFSYVATDGVATSNTATVAINVVAVNDAPVANTDILAAVEDVPVTYTAAQLTGNDTDAEGNALSIASVTSGLGGVAVLNANGTVTFTGFPNFNGAASFSYTTTDGQLTSNTALVTVNVAAVNDAPVANADALSANAGVPVTYTAAQLTGNDTDVEGSPLSIVFVGSGAGGTAVLNANGTVTFTPAPGFSGQAAFSYVVSDGVATSNFATASVTVAPPINVAPLANADTLAATEDAPVIYTAAQLLGNDTDADGNALSIASVTSGAGGTAVLNPNGTVTFTPNANFNGEASFSYVATDGTAV
ncbi:MAG: cadherin-like domain-containing protein, partial [Betaproteobacteria bacterium]